MGLIESDKVFTTVSYQFAEAKDLLFKSLRNVNIFQKSLQFCTKLSELVPDLIERKKV